jgi:DcmR-like sensory protein
LTEEQGFPMPFKQILTHQNIGVKLVLPENNYLKHKYLNAPPQAVWYPRSVTRKRINAHHHAVQFYGNDDSLITTVGAFLSEGLVAGHPAIVFATRAHATAIERQLATRLIDVATAVKIGDLVLLDADQALASFMVDDVPHPGKFRYEVGGLIERTLGDRKKMIVRAYGEMVDVLWKQGREEAAIRLEILWNQLATQFGFALLCGYSMGNFYKQAEKFQEVCRQHSHVLDADTNVVIFDQKRRVKTA